MSSKKVEYLIVDTSAFIKNAPLQDIGNNIITTQEVVDEIVNKRQLRRLVVLPYDLKIKDTFAENVAFVTEFSKKTGDYLSLSATDIKVIALTYQLEKEHVGTDHLKDAPVITRTVNVSTKPTNNEVPTDIAGFFLPSKVKSVELSGDSDSESESSSLSDESEPSTDSKILTPELIEVEIQGNQTHELAKKFATLQCADVKFDEENVDDVLVSVKRGNQEEFSDGDEEGTNGSDEDYSDDETGWITPSNVSQVKKDLGSAMLEEKAATVACMTTDFAMQNVLKQIGLNVTALDGRVIKQLRTFILRCYTCFKTSSVMTKLFCPSCGHKTLKRVAVSLDADGKQQIHINLRRPLTSRGKRFSLPTPQGGKHAQNPVLFEDQRVPEQRASRLASMANDPLNPDYIAGYSPFIMRDTNSRSAMLGIRSNNGNMKHWMRKNPNEARRKRK